jgi:tetratricopeptide (TPR) repeat protein
MKFHRQIVVVAGLWAAFALALAAAAPAADRNAEFVEALRQAGYDDTALDFIDWVDKSPLATDEFRGQAIYERAVSLAAKGRQSRNADERARLLAEAAESFETFAKSDRQSAEALDSLRQSANLYAELAVAFTSDAKRIAQRSPGAAGETVRGQARDNFERAARIAGDLAELCTKRLAELPKPAVAVADPKTKALRDLLLGRQVEARFLVALIGFEQSKTYDDGSAEQQKSLDAASKKFGKLVEEFPQAPVGASSRFYQGRCAQQQGDYAAAIKLYKNVDAPASSGPEFRRWAARARRCLAECLLAQDKIDDAIDQSEKWLDDSAPDERKQPEWLEVGFRLADAYQRKVKDLKSSSDVKRLHSKIRNLLRDVAASPNEFQSEARLGLASLAQRTQGDANYTNFADALAAGKAALELMNSAKLAARLARDNNPEAVAELESDVGDQRDIARSALERARDLADGQTPPADLNAVRYFLCVIYWEEGRIEDAAVMAEFVAVRHPESQYAPNAASVALAAWEKMYRDGRAAGAAAAGAAGSSAFAGKKLAEMAQLVAAHWPDAPEAAPAVNILISVAISENRVDEAEKLLAKLPAEKRATAQLSLGAALWAQYLRMTAGRDAQFDAAANAVREKAATLLTTGFAEYRKSGPPTTNATIASLYLVQLLLSRADAAASLDVLEDAEVGPLTLVQSESEVAASPELILETYKTSLRTYLSIQPPHREEAQDVMKSLDEFVATQGDAAAEKLTQIYLGLGVQVQRQMKDLTAAGQGAQAEQMAAAFGDLLARVTERSDSSDWKVRNWIAETNLQIGQGLPAEQAKPYLLRAQQSYDAVLALAKQGGAGAPSAARVLNVRRRLADCLVALGKYKEGVEQYAQVLSKKPAMLEMQQAAAAAYQAWGVAEKQLTALDKSIQGASPGSDGKNAIWGWIRLAQQADNARRRAAALADKDPQAAENAQRFEDLFYEARYHVAEVRFVAAGFTQGEARGQQLEAARRNIESMRTLYPDLGGPKWKAAFEALLKQVNQELKP